MIVGLIYLLLVVIDIELGVHLLLNQTKQKVKSGNEVLLIPEVGFSLVRFVGFTAFLLILEIVKFSSGL